jgi:hypothetical protein
MDASGLHHPVNSLNDKKLEWDSLESGFFFITVLGWEKREKYF